MTRGRQSGQAMLELLGALAFILPLLAGLGWVFKDEWNRARCAYLVFEAAHARLAGNPSPTEAARVRLEETSESIEAEGRCGKAQETVQLWKLEQDS